MREMFLSDKESSFYQPRLDRTLHYSLLRTHQTHYLRHMLMLIFKGDIGRYMRDASTLAWPILCSFRSYGRRYFLQPLGTLQDQLQWEDTRINYGGIQHCLFFILLHSFTFTDIPVTFYLTIFLRKFVIRLVIKRNK